MFKFDEYPGIKKAYREHKRLVNTAYKLESKIRADDEKSEEPVEAAIVASEKFDYEVFAPVIFSVFKDIKPKLYNGLTNKFEKWDKVFPDEWEKFTRNEKSHLLGLVLEIGCGGYWLPNEYYDDTPKCKGMPWPTRHDKPFTY
ncbi:MAG: hypothetical protein LBP26_01060 [Clostridiales bacterium]|jgi:hypothetical protein|nr:hypothetical protein [Clostridiales bacterium]